MLMLLFFFFFFQAEDGIRDVAVTGVQTCALPISVAFRVPYTGGILTETGDHTMAHKSSSTLASSTLAETVGAALDSLQIELPSWGFADTGTRFGKFHQPAARTTEEKFADAGQVHKFTGACPTVALHVLWDVPEGTEPRDIKKLAERHGVRPRSIRPTVVQEQLYKHAAPSYGPEPGRRGARE